MANVDLDALITREDFEVIGEGDEAPIKGDIQVSDLESNAFFFGALRKPDFQRETLEWDAKRIVGLIRSFINDELIPAVILWKNKDLLFVIDGSHRLSALIAWVQDDYGDGERSQAFLGPTIPEEQVKIAQRTRSLVEKEFGAYKDHRKANENPANYGPDIVRRARKFGSLGIKIQWVRGDATKAEDSFVRINQQAVNITPQELELIKSRKKPNAIAARAIIRRGTGHKYWSSFGEQEQTEIQRIATDLHRLIFHPPLEYPIKSLDLPAGGSVYSGTALRMVYDFINLSVGATAPEDDDDGTRTIEYLRRTRRVMRLLLSNDASSLGLHPAVYFYSWTGKQQPILFLVIASLIVDLERNKRLPQYVRNRKRFEDFLTSNRSLINQVVRKFGTKSSGIAHLRDFYNKVYGAINDCKTPDEVVEFLTDDPTYSYLQPSETPYDPANPPKRMSSQVRSGFVMRELLGTAPRCPICRAVVPPQAVSIDHKERLEDGGSAGTDNAQLTHPYCNTGYKESLHAKALKAQDTLAK